MFIRVLFFSMMLTFVASAQSPSGSAQAPPPENYDAALDKLFGADTANPQRPEVNKPPSAWSAFGSLVFVLAIAGGGIWALRKWGIKRLPGSGGTRMKIEETLALGERRYVSILKVDEERFLIASYPQGVGLLGRLEYGNVEPGFGRQLEQQMHIQAPIPVREMEAQLKGEQQ